MDEAANVMMCTEAYTIWSLVCPTSSDSCTFYIYPGFSPKFAIFTESATWMDDRIPTLPILLFKGHTARINKDRPRMKSNARKMITKEDILLHRVQHFFFFSGPLPPIPPPPEGISNTVMPSFGGRRKVPPAPRCFLRRRRSPCSNFGGRLACNELMIPKYCCGQYLGRLCHVLRLLS